MSVDCHWSHWSYLQCHCQCRPTLLTKNFTLYIASSDGFISANTARNQVEQGCQKKGSQLENSRFSFVPIKGINLWEHLEGCQTTALLLTSVGAPSLLNGKSPESMEYYFLAFPGNPGIKEQSRVPDQSQKVKAFLHLRKSPETIVVWKIVSWLSGLFHEFLESQGSMDTPGFSQLFLRFSARAKTLAKPGIFC